MKLFGASGGVKRAKFCHYVGRFWVDTCRYVVIGFQMEVNLWLVSCLTAGGGTDGWEVGAEVGSTVGTRGRELSWRARVEGLLVGAVGPR